jgi:tRNA threonylcarbamoyladenosine biosynthesis protein TsaE
MTPPDLILHSESEAETAAIGRRLGETLPAGALVILCGDLGAGKTRLVAGIATGMAVEGEISSPTFVLERIHPGRVGRPTLHHLDLYRAPLGDEECLGIEENLMGGDVVVVEWGEKIPPERRVGAIEIRIEFGEREDDRLLRFIGPLPEGFVSVNGNDSSRFRRGTACCAPTRGRRG